MQTQSQLKETSSAAHNGRASIRRAVPISLGSSPATFYTFRNLSDPQEHIAIAFGNWARQASPLVRIHSECLTGDIFQSSRCDCGKQLHEALEKMKRTGGLLIYLRQEGRGIGLYSKLDAYVLQDQGWNTYEANRLLNYPPDARNYAVAAEMLSCLGVFNIQLITNNPDKRRQIEAHGISVAKRVSTGVFLTLHNGHYLAAKRSHGKHDLDLPTMERSDP